MARNGKKSLENNVDVESIINNLLKINRLKLEEFLLETGISLDSYRKALTNQRLTGPNVENILAKVDVNEGYLNGTEDLTLSGKLTSVQDEAAITPKTLAVSEAIMTVVKEGTEYYVIPKIIFQQRYILVSEEQFNKDNEKWDQDKQTFKQLLTLFEKELDKRESAPKPESTKDAQHGS